MVIYDQLYRNGCFRVGETTCQAQTKAIMDWTVIRIHLGRPDWSAIFDWSTPVGTDSNVISQSSMLWMRKAPLGKPVSLFCVNSWCSSKTICGRSKLWQGGCCCRCDPPRQEIGPGSAVLSSYSNCPGFWHHQPRPQRPLNPRFGFIRLISRRARLRPQADFQSMDTYAGKMNRHRCFNHLWLTRR